MPPTRGQPAGDEWDDWVPEPTPPAALGDDDWDGFDTRPPPPVLPEPPVPPEAAARADPPPPIERASPPSTSPPSTRAGWPSAALYVSFVAVLLSGFALYFALDRINVLDPGTITNTGLLLLATILLSGIVFSCVLAAVAALIRRLSVWRASVTIAVGTFLAPAVLYYAMIQGVNSMRENVGRSVIGQVPDTAVRLRELAIENGVDAGWLIIVLDIVAG